MLDENNAYEISLASRADLKQIVRIYNESICERNATADLAPTSVRSRLAWFKAHGKKRPIFVLRAAKSNLKQDLIAKSKNDDEILAWASLSDYKSREAYSISAEISVYVAKSARGQGLGKILCEYVLDVAPKFGIKNILAVIFADNAPSVGLFEKFGFAKWGRLPQICDMAGDIKDVVILGKRLCE